MPSYTYYGGKGQITGLHGAMLRRSSRSTLLTVAWESRPSEGQGQSLLGDPDLDLAFPTLSRDLATAVAFSLQNGEPALQP